MISKSGAGHLDAGKESRGRLGTNMPDKIKTMAASGMVKDARLSIDTLPSSVAATTTTKPIARPPRYYSKRRWLVAKQSRSRPEAIPTIRTDITTVTVLKTLSTDDRNGSETKAATMATIDPATRPFRRFNDPFRFSTHNSR
jgi:hypothetical protein